MADTINGRTPDEIKRGLECCKPVWVDNHWKTCDTKCPYIDNVDEFCRTQLMADALALIQQLENHIGELAEMVRQLERERDAAVQQLKQVDVNSYFECAHCKHEELCDSPVWPCNDCDSQECPCHTCADGSNWEWRGVQNDG